MAGAAMMLVALVELGCKPACEDQGLRSAAQAFELRTFDARQEGFELLTTACPTLPPTLGRSLRAEFDTTPAEDRLALYRDRPKDPAWRELHDRTCLQSPDDQDPHTRGFDERIRASCTLERYGLFTPDDPFVYRDLVAMMLYEWLISGRVDRALASTVVRPLLSASARPEQLQAMCLDEGLACTWAMTTWGVELPRSSVEWPIRGGVELLLTPSQLSVERTPVLSLHAGHPAPDAFAHHVAPALQQAFATRTGSGRFAARTEGTLQRSRVTFVADHATPARTLVDTFFTASKAGFSDGELVVFGVGELHALPLHVPRAWLPPDPNGPSTARSLDLTFVVHRDSVEASCGHMGARSFPSRDLEAITAYATDIKRLFPLDTAATFRADDDVPLHALVSVIDAVRGGEACRSRELEPADEIPPECLFYMPILDANPPLYFHADGLATLELGNATIERGEDHVSGGPSNEAILAAYATAREEIRRCVVDHPALLAELDEEDRITILYGSTPGDPPRPTARVVHRRVLDDDELERCVLASVGLEPDRPTSMSASPPGVYATLVIPTRFVPTTDQQHDPPPASPL